MIYLRSHRWYAVVPLKPRVSILTHVLVPPCFIKGIYPGGWRCTVPVLSYGSFWIPAQPNSTSGWGSCASPFLLPPFQGVFPPRSQVLNSPGKASHVLRAGVQVYLRRGKCYYGNYNSIKKQSVAVSIQDHKNAHQFNSFLLETL